MKTYKLKFESKEGMYEINLTSKSRTESENIAEDIIKSRFFKDSDEYFHFFYTLEDLETKKKRLLTVCSSIAPIK